MRDINIALSVAVCMLIICSALAFHAIWLTFTGL